ncbi:hypothetical protein ACO0K2_17390 [Undibacterium sp. MH2W]|uniref:hypothetical protein n=1 Tax=Undibacterium sp. MH2W TaxID=3413044 RepID=UPI003BF40403
MNVRKNKEVVVNTKNRSIRKILANQYVICLLSGMLGISVAAAATNWEMRAMWQECLSGGVAGLALGLFFLIDMRNYSKIKKMTLSGLVGTIAGLVFSVLLSASMPLVLISVLAGAILGFTSGVWIYHVNLP